MKLYSSIILTVVVGMAQAGECPRGHTRSVEADGTIRLVYATGLVTTISPRYEIDHRYEFTSDQQRQQTLTYCNLGPSHRPRAISSTIVGPTGQILGTITTK